MLKLYFKQALELMRQNKLFSGLYVFGTALAIATTTIMAVMIYVKVAPLYPEYNRGNIYYIEDCTFHRDNSWSTGGAGSYLAVKEWYYPLKNAEAVSAELAHQMPTEVASMDGRANMEVKSRGTDPAFFKIYSYKFIDGKPFTQADLDGAIKTVAISDVVAETLFGTTTGVVGKSIMFDTEEYKVCGVFEEPSRAMTDSYAQLIHPYTTFEGALTMYSNNIPHNGNYVIYVLCRDAEQGEALRAEIKDIERKYNAAMKDKKMRVEFKHYPIVTWQKVLSGGEEENTWKRLAVVFGSIFLVLLLVPALNLSGMISGRMDMRCQELGVRKSFGATRGALLSQVMWENMVLTLVGGILGFVITVFTLFMCRNWIFSLLDMTSDAMGDVNITSEMLFSPTIFLFSFLVCIILNFMSALIPAWRSLRRPIVDSLNVKK